MTAREPSPAERFEIARFGIFMSDVLGPLDFDPEEET